ncbi:MAG: hypothetical protein PHY59_08275 [Methanobacterium sp.]|nr:hypothetical protein [Methanobacterium sp.]
MVNERMGLFKTKIMKNPLFIIFVLVIFAVALFACGKGVDNYVPPQNPAEITAVSIGETVLSGQHVVDNTKIRKIPVIYHPEYLMEDLKNKQFIDFFIAITTGSVETPINMITEGYISRYGDATGFDGPGMVSVNGSKLIVNPPETFVWAFKTPYTIAVKTDKGIDIRTENKTVLASDINNDTIPTMYISAEDLKNWYKYSNIGNSIGLDFSLSKFNDGRNSVPPSKILNYFGNDIMKYMIQYPSDTPVMVYNSATNQEVIGSGSSVLEAFAEYNNVLREENARTFVKAWNNTIIPPHTSASGKQDVTFTGVYDKEEGGYPSHGTCPPGRALRSSVMSAGCPLPLGMTGGYFAVALGSDPATGIKVYNPTNYPIKIIMWTSGRGTGMMIYSQIIQYMP